MKLAHNYTHLTINDVMTRKWILWTLALLMATPATGRTVRDFFADEPGALFTLLPRTVRLDLLDYYDNGTLVQASNNLGDGTRLDTLTDNFLRLHTSRVKVVEMRLMRFKNDTIIATIETVMTPVPDSRIKFYNKHWVPLSAIKPFKMPTLADFMLPSADKKKREEILAGMPFELIELSFCGDRFEQLCARHGLAEFLSQEEWSRIKAHFRPTLLYQVKDGKIK